MVSTDFGCGLVDLVDTIRRSVAKGEKEKAASIFGGRQLGGLGSIM